MRTIVILFSIFLVVVSCKKEDDPLNSKYQSIYGTWEPKVVVYDSSGVNTMQPIPYEKLVINQNLSYTIYINSNTSIEDGKIKVLSQTNDKLELYFNAIYPPQSSFAGSHIFGMSDLVLSYISDTVMTLKSTNDVYHHYPEFFFRKLK